MGADRGAGQTVTEEEAIVRAIARHGTPKLHMQGPVFGGNGRPCLCWSDARRVLNDIYAAGFEVVRRG